MSHSITYYDDGTLAQFFFPKNMVRFKIYEHEGKKHLGMHVHGNWVGPGWSANKFQGSTLDYSVPYIDDFDRTGREHDFDYNIGNNLAMADYNFFKNNVFKGNPFTVLGAKRWASTWAVGAQGLGRQLGLIPKQGKVRSISSFPQKDMAPVRGKGRKRPRTYSAPPTPSKRVAYGSRTPTSKALVVYRGSGQVGRKGPPPTKSGGRKLGNGKGTSKKSMPMKFTVKKFKRRTRRKRKARGYDIVNFVQESRGAIDDPESVYVGHSIPSTKLVLNMLKRLLKDTYKKAGITIIDYRDITADLSDLGYWTIVWRDSQTSATIRRASIVVFQRIGPSKTYDAVCGEMLAAIRAGGSGGMSGSAGLKVDWQISELTTNNASEKHVHASIDLKYYMMQIDFKSTLKVQNVTAATAGTGGEFESDNITSNPLSVTCYENKRQTNGFYVNHVFPGDSLSDAGDAPFIANQQTGTIDVDPSLVGSGTTMSHTFKKPPPPTVFDAAKKGGKTILAPGAFLQSYVTWSGTFSFATMMNKIGMFIFQSGGQQHIPIGNVKLYGFEHYMKAPAADANVSIQHETVHRFTIGSHYVKQKTQPYVEVV